MTSIESKGMSRGQHLPDRDHWWCDQCSKGEQLALTEGAVHRGWPGGTVWWLMEQKGLVKIFSLYSLWNITARLNYQFLISDKTNQRWCSYIFNRKHTNADVSCEQHYHFCVNTSFWKRMDAYALWCFPLDALLIIMPLIIICAHSCLFSGTFLSSVKTLHKV